MAPANDPPTAAAAAEARAVLAAHLAALSTWGIRRIARGASAPATGARLPAPVPAPAPAASAPERLPRETIVEQLAACAAEVAACTLCGLATTRTRTVFGTGNPQARLMFVGEAPGRDEDLAGEPFVGRAGQLLDKIVAAMGLTREEVYIANIVKCRPPENREPAPGEVGCCTPYLKRQIRAIRPEMIVALGRPAACFLLGRSASLRSLRGVFHEFEGIPVAVTYHPAYLLRTPEDKKLTWQDMQRVMERLGLPLPR